MKSTSLNARNPAKSRLCFPPKKMFLLLQSETNKMLKKRLCPHLHAYCARASASIVACKKPFRVLLQLQFVIENNCDAPRTEDVKMLNATIRTSKNDPFWNFLEARVCIF